MKDFNYIIIGGGCAGLSLAYELEINNKLENKTLAIIEPRTNYIRDKTWSFWRIRPHNFEDCVIKSWDNFSVHITDKTNYIDCVKTPYQSIDSGLFYKKIISKLKNNKNIYFLKTLEDLNVSDALIFNSLANIKSNKNNLWQHFGGVEIETEKKFFDKEIMNLMDFDCDQKNSVHFFYTLPFAKNKALIETTWLSKMNDEYLKDYDIQLKKYIDETLKIKKYKINYQEEGAIPLFYPQSQTKKNTINIGSAGGMTRLSTGYTFLNIQNHSKYIVKNIDKIQNLKSYHIGKKYEFLDNIFLNVLKNQPDLMPKIFLNMFKAPSKTVIKFLSNKSNIFEDFGIILKMPKWIFIKNIF